MRVVAAWGDLLVSRTISICSSSLLSYPRWAPSHLALILRTTPEVELLTGRGQLWVESSALIPRPCIIHKTQIVGIQAHRVEDRTSDYPKGNVLCYRLRKNYELSDYEEEYLSNLVFNEIFKADYDVPDCGMFSSIVKKLLFKSKNTLLCSEFVHDLLMHLGRSPIENPSKHSPGSLLRDHLRRGILVEEGPIDVNRDYFVQEQ